MWQGVNDALRQMTEVGPATQNPAHGSGRIGIVSAAILFTKVVFITSNHSTHTSGIPAGKTGIRGFTVTGIPD